jgi:tetratricopeptide (TPR) repeat protein
MLGCVYSTSSSIYDGAFSDEPIIPLADPVIAPRPLCQNHREPVGGGLRPFEESPESDPSLVPARATIELNSNYALAHHMYANLLTGMGRFDEGISERKRALEIDPLSLRTSALLGWDYYVAGRYDEAITQYRRTSELDPNYPLIHLGAVYERKGMNDQAITEYLKEETRSGRSEAEIDALKSLTRPRE